MWDRDSHINTITTDKNTYFRSLRDSYLCSYIAPSREDVRNKLRQILRMTKFGDWLMFYLLAHNMDKARPCSCTWLHGTGFQKYRWRH